ncbi:1312_t:CDS:2 [Gigaspora rosea]|nr:1312_t:CDS:2 [Gigaspora rosea]
MADPNIRTTPRLKVSLNKTSHEKKLVENETKSPPNIKLDQWKRLQELKRRREEIQNGSNKKKKNQKDREEIEKKLDQKRSDSLSAPDQTTSQSIHLVDQTIPPIIPKSLVKYVNMNSHLKGVDHGRLAPKGRLEKELDKAREEELKAKKKKPKLKWGFESKHRWETKSILFHSQIFEFYHIKLKKESILKLDSQDNHLLHIIEIFPCLNKNMVKIATLKKKKHFSKTSIDAS